VNSSLSGDVSQSNIIRPKRSAVAEAKAMSKSEDSQTSLDQSENHSLKGSVFTVSTILPFNLKVYVLCCVFKTLTLDSVFVHVSIQVEFGDTVILLKI